MSVFDRLEMLLRSEWSARRSSGAGSRALPEGYGRDLGEARAVLRTLLQEEQLLEQRIQKSRREIQYRESQAERAVAAFDEQRARLELRRKLQEEERLRRLERDWDELRLRIDEWQTTLQRFERAAASNWAPDELIAPPAPDPGAHAAPGAGYYRSLRAAPDAESRVSRGETRSTSAPRPAPRSDRGDRRTPWSHGHDLAATNELSGGAHGPFERFDEMSDRIEGGLAETAATHELTKLSSYSGDGGYDGDDPLADPLEQKLKSLANEQELERLKRGRDGHDRDGSTDPLGRLRQRLRDPETED